MPQRPTDQAADLPLPRPSLPRPSLARPSSALRFVGPISLAVLGALSAQTQAQQQGGTQRGGQENAKRREAAAPPTARAAMELPPSPSIEQRRAFYEDLKKRDELYRELYQATYEATQAHLQGEPSPEKLERIEDLRLRIDDIEGRILPRALRWSLVVPPPPEKPDPGQEPESVDPQRQQFPRATQDIKQELQRRGQLFLKRLDFKPLLQRSPATAEQPKGPDRPRP